MTLDTTSFGILSSIKCLKGYQRGKKYEKRRKLGLVRDWLPYWAMIRVAGPPGQGMWFQGKKVGRESGYLKQPKRPPKCREPKGEARRGPGVVPGSIPFWLATIYPVLQFDCIYFVHIFFGIFVATTFFVTQILYLKLKFTKTT